MNEYNGVMCDFETLDKLGTSAVISIGLVKFNLEDEDNYESLEEDGRTFDCVFDIQDQLNMGRTVSFDTLQWWMQQDKMAQAVFQRKPNYRNNEEALLDMVRWLNDCTNMKLWGNGAAFDNVIFASLFETYGIPNPFKFWNDMCFRTLKSLSPRKVELDRGIAHDALDDAKYQTLLAQEYYRILRNGDEA